MARRQLLESAVRDQHASGLSFGLVAARQEASGIPGSDGEAWINLLAAEATQIRRPKEDLVSLLRSFIFLSSSTEDHPGFLLEGSVALAEAGGVDPAMV